MEEEKSSYPVVVTGSSKEEVAKVKRDALPAHYIFKIESFSKLREILSTTEFKKYETRDFEVGGYKWKLSLYPDGDTNKNGSNHISLYLVLSETNDLPLSREVDAFFKLFVYDQIRDQYLTVQDISKKPIRFNALKTECGFSQFLPLATFNDVSSGYLINDCCVFGVEVFVTNCTGKGECVSFKKPPEIITHKMEKFSKLDRELYHSSPVKIAGYNWFTWVYPRGNTSSNEKYLSLFLGINFGTCPKRRIWADYKLRVKNQARGLSYEMRVQKWFTASEKNWGFPQFLQLSELKDKSKGYVVSETLIVEVEFIHVLGVNDL